MFNLFYYSHLDLNQHNDNDRWPKYQVVSSNGYVNIAGWDKGQQIADILIY